MYLHVRVLYANTVAMVSTNGIHSCPFPIFQGCRQGDGLSPTLFILSLEPLAKHLRQNVISSPTLLKLSTHIISLYADDILLYMTDIHNSIPSLLSTFEELKLLSGYKIQ
jgi:hypothetical protein